MVDYWNTEISLNPQCPHGPTLLFSRKGADRKFYACAAFRNRKQCSFFVWEDEVQKRKGAIQLAVDTNRERFKNIRKTPPPELGFCYTCERLYTTEETSSHGNHNTRKPVCDLLQWPSLLLHPRTESKGESQYYFSENSVKRISIFLTSLKISRVICIGCPYLHEYISNNSETMQSMLLDIDHRYLQFYSEDRFQLFNMFNCHVFDSNGMEYVRKFVMDMNVAIVADPPFGGRIEPIAYTFKLLSSEFNVDKEVKMFLILPYFMEPAVKRSFPNFQMSDYKVEYRNHTKFKKCNNETGISKSAVRIFTNVELAQLSLSEEKGYKFCEICEYWVCKENNHCYKCETCTSKNGEPYKHCNRCKKCVKKTWKHCQSCGICKLLEHKCEKSVQNPSVEKIQNSSSKRKKANSSKNKRKLKRVK